MIDVDGSYGEGGGQILRNAIALGVLLNEDINITNIRANRPNPGIKPQHYTAIKIIEKICNAETDGLKIGSSNLYFSPSDINEGFFKFDIGTAGSIVLVFQACLLSFLNSKKNIKIKLKGGTDVKWSPSWDYFERVFLTLIKKMGLYFETKLIHRGYYPKGGGEAILSIKPCKKLKPLNIREIQYFNEIFGIINISNLPEHIATRMKDYSINKAKENGLKSFIEISSSNSLSPGVGITIWSHSRDSIMGKTKLGEKGISAEVIGKNIVNLLCDEIKSGATIDTNLIDQILPYMILANDDEPSFCSVSNLSGHTETNIWLINKFINKNNNIKISKNNNLTNIETNGINLFR